MPSSLFDEINNADQRTAANAAMSVIDRLQDYRPAVQAHALATGFLVMCETLKLNPAEVFQRSQNLMAHSDGTRRAEFRALKAYMENEVAER